jgi:hypothetical protein
MLRFFCAHASAALRRRLIAGGSAVGQSVADEATKIAGAAPPPAFIRGMVQNRWQMLMDRGKFYSKIILK